MPHNQIDEIFSCLGPVFFHLRLSSKITREKSNGMDIAFEILRWLCVNTKLLERLPGLTQLGQVSIRCSKCDLQNQSRQMYRYRIHNSNNIFDVKGRLYFCCYCLLHEVQNFLTGVPGLISNGEVTHQADILILILRRTQRARDFHCRESDVYTVLPALLNHMNEARGFLAECLRPVGVFTYERHYKMLDLRPYTERMRAKRRRRCII